MEPIFRNMKFGYVNFLCLLIMKSAHLQSILETCSNICSLPSCYLKPLGSKKLNFKKATKIQRKLIYGTLSSFKFI